MTRTKMTRLLAALGACCLITACASTSAPVSTAPIPFNRTDFDWSARPGRGAIEGRLTYAARGATYSCETIGVVLTPETPWVRRRMQILYQSPDRAALPATQVRARTPAGSQDYSAFVKAANCDAAGRFSFSGLPDGAWFVITVGRPTPAGEDIAIMRRVVIRNGATVRLTL